MGWGSTLAESRGIAVAVRLLDCILSAKGYFSFLPPLGEPMSIQCSLVVLRIDIPEVTGDQIAGELQDRLLSLYEQSQAIHAIVDMQPVTYLSSVGIGPLLALYRKVHEREGRLILCSMTENVESVFHATKLIGSRQGSSATFGYQADVPTAVQSLYQGE